MKKVISIFLAITMSFTILVNSTVIVNAQTYTGKCGDNITYTFDSESGLLVIEGSGNMRNFEQSSVGYYPAPWYSRYSSSVKTVVIGEGVTSIGDYSFYGCNNLTSISIPNTISDIGYCAFSGCDNLGSIIIPNNLTTIGDGAFAGCDGIRTINIPDGITSFGNSAFSGCDNLTYINIPDSVTSIGEYAFDSCINLTSLTIPNSVKSIGQGAFFDCSNLKSIILPKDIKIVSSALFHSCIKLQNVELPENITSIESSAFRNCTSLEEINIPNSVTSIKESAFLNCSTLSEIKIPDKVNSIGMNAFNGCKNLKNVIIPTSVMSIGWGAFSGCDNIGTIVVRNPECIIGTGSSSYMYPECTFGGGKDANQKPVVYGYENSTAQSFVEKYSDYYFFDIIDIDESPDVSNTTSKQWYFEEPIVIIDIGEPKDLSVHSRDVAIVNGELVYSNDQLVSNENLVWSVATGFENIIEVAENGIIKGLSNDLAILTATHKDDINLSATCFVYVGDPNTVNLNCSYDTKYYYSNNAFVNSDATTSEYIDIQYDISNKIVNELRDIISEVDYHKYFTDVSPITLTATVSGNDLSFNSQKYQNTYKTTISELSIEETISNNMKLYPYDMVIAENGDTYTVTVTLESESFGTITKKCSFLIKNDSFGIKVYTAYPTSEIGVGQTVKFFAELYRNDTLVNSEQGYSAITIDSTVVKVTEIKQADNGYYFTMKGLAEGRSNIIITDVETKASATISVDVVDNCAFFRCSAFPIPYESCGSIYVSDYVCESDENGNHDISFNAYNTSYAYGTVEVYNNQGTLIKVIPLSPRTDGSGMEKVVNGFKYVWEDVKDVFDGDTAFYTKDSNAKHTYVFLENIPENAEIIITSDGNESMYSILYNSVDVFVQTVFAASSLDVKIDGQQASVQELVKALIENVPTSAIQSATKELSSSMIQGATSESVSTIYEAIFNMFGDAGIDFGTILKKTLIGMGYGAADAIVTTAIPAYKIVTFVDQILEITWPLVDYEFNLDRGKLEIHTTMHGLKNYLTNNSVTVTQQSNFNNKIVLDAYIVVEESELEAVPETNVHDLPLFDIYNITLRENGKEIQPKEEIEVRIPVPLGADAKKCVVYRIEENGERTLLQSRVDDNYLVFKTLHLSYYIIGQKDCEHFYSSSWSNDETYHWKECTIDGCGIVINGTKAEHTSTGSNVVTCQKAAVCNVCGLTYGAVAAHDYADTYSKDASGHWYACQTSGCTEKEGFAVHAPDHQGGATEEYPIKCTVCGWIIEQQLAHNHVFDQKVVDEQYKVSGATCTEAAKYYKSCKCGEKSTETFAFGEALGHIESTDWKSDKDKHWNECVCGEMANVAAHKDDDRDGKCDICEYEVDTITNDPDNNLQDTNKPSNDVQSPQTGDNSMMWLWIVMLFVSASALISLTAYRRRRKNIKIYFGGLR